MFRTKLDNLAILGHGHLVIMGTICPAARSYGTPRSGVQNGKNAIRCVVEFILNSEIERGPEG